tara:strand:- start:506 stop:1240 length:735 start_codon:yes stop_codon:yes gene_type:complete
MNKLLVKFPTRNRPDKFKEIFGVYSKYLDDNYETRFVITCDSDDESMNNPEMIDWFKRQQINLESRGHSLIYHYGNSKTKIQACNANLEGESADVLMLASDDMWPQIRGYNRVILDGMKECFPDGDGAIKFNDGLRTDILMTLAVMGWKLYERFGYIYHPDYTSVYPDTEQTAVCHYSGRLAVSDIIICKHQWTSQAFDELHGRNENQAMYHKDGEVYRRRMQNRFDMDAMGIDYQWPKDPLGV